MGRLHQRGIARSLVAEQAAVGGGGVPEWADLVQHIFICFKRGPGVSASNCAGTQAAIERPVFGPCAGAGRGSTAAIAGARGGTVVGTGSAVAVAGGGASVGWGAVAGAVG